MQIEWQEYLSIGILEVDIQHRLLFEKFNDFLAACEAHKGPEEVTRLFWFLEAYAMTHFSQEERLMQRLGCPDFANHRRQHQEFVAKIASFKESLASEGPTSSLVFTVTRFISSWLVGHISKMDRAIGAVGATAATADRADVLGS